MSGISPRWRRILLIFAGIGIVAAFLVLNRGAWTGYFQDDELDNLTWGPVLALRTYLGGLLDPRFQTDNFRPAGSLYFALMGRAFGLEFAPYVAAIFLIHILNAALLYGVGRKIHIAPPYALGASAFFALSAGAFDAYWKPMYVFDLLCTTFSLLSIFFYTMRRWVLSFAAFWFAYKAKELAVMLPSVLLAYEFWLGERRMLRLIPFCAASLSFGIQGILLNPNHNNDYTLHFSRSALASTIPFYARRILLFRFSGILLLVLAVVRDRRIWFGLSLMLLVMVPLLFLPGRLFEAYTYLPLTGAAIAMAAAASHINPVWAAALFALWVPSNIREIHHRSRDVLAADHQNRAFVTAMADYIRGKPASRVLVCAGTPAGFHLWGIRAAWFLLHARQQSSVYWIDTPEARQALAAGEVAFCEWNPVRQGFDFLSHKPSALLE
jgi:hypothetical protein